MPRNIIEAGKPAVTTTVSESLTLEALTTRFHFQPEAVRFRIRRDARNGTGRLFLWPEDHAQEERLTQIIGLGEDERLRIFSPPAYQLTEGDIGSWLVKRGRSIITVVPHPIEIAKMEKAGLIKTEPQAMPDNFRFNRSGDRWIGRIENGPMVVPLKSWDPGFDPTDTNQSLAHSGLKMRPALTACLWIAGPAGIIGKATTEELSVTVFDEEIASAPRFSYAPEFMVLGELRTAFEIFSTPDMLKYYGVKREGTLYHGFTVDSDQFRADIEAMIERGDTWLMRTLYALLHTDLQGTGYEEPLGRLLDASAEFDETARQTLIEQAAAAISSKDIRDVCETSMREGAKALDWLKGWGQWAAKEMQTREKRQLRILIPQPYNRMPRQIPPMVEFDTGAVATHLLEHIRAEITRRSPQLSTQTETRMPEQKEKKPITDPALIQRLFRLAPPPRVKPVAQPTVKPKQVAKSEKISPPPTPPSVRSAGPAVKNGLGASSPEAAQVLATVAKHLNGDESTKTDGNGHHGTDAVKCQECGEMIFNIPADHHIKTCTEHTRPRKKGGKPQYKRPAPA